MALFRRRTSLAEALAAVRAELEQPEARRAPPPELIDLQRLLQSELQQGELPAPGQDELVVGFPEPAAVVDAQGRFLMVNERLDALLGRPRAKGLTVLEATRSGELAEAAAAAAHGKASDAEHCLPSLQKVVRAWFCPLTGRRALLVLRDLTEARRLESVRRDFIANASHELRTPVAAISGAVETLLGGGVQLEASTRTFVEMIARNADRLARLTTDLLDLSRLESGQFKPELGPIELVPFCEACVELVRGRAQVKEIVLNADAPPGLRVLADRRALEQIVVNLLDNAVKFTPRGGRVTLLADGAGAQVVISIIDTGAGIEERHKERIFERFYRADPGRAREAGGTGLGLAIVKHLALAQGGQVGVESGPGGSRFWVKLPAA